MELRNFSYCWFGFYLTIAHINQYQVPFVEGNWVIDTENAINVNDFQLKLTSKMFEMFALFINILNLTIPDAIFFKL